MNTFNQPPETDVPLALAFPEKQVPENNPILDADLTDTKAVKKREATLHETEIVLDSNRPGPPKLKLLNIIDFSRPGQNGQKTK